MSEDVTVIMNTIEKLADKLGIAVTDVARIFMEAQTKIGMVDLILMILVFGISLIVFVVLFYLFQIEETNFKENMWENAGAAFTLTFFIWIILFVATLFISDPLHKIVAPEYMGLKEMLFTIGRII
jgi:uncharacterized membrane-anchored protein